MRERLLAFVHALRAVGARISLAETLDAVRAVAVAGVEREVLRETLAATVLKDEGDRPAFDRLFEAHFPLGGAGETPGRGRRGAAGAGAGERGRGRSGAGQGGREQAGSPGATGERGEPVRRDARPEVRRRVLAATRKGDRSDATPARTARAQHLLALPFRDFTARDVVEARDLVRELGRRLRARLARRERARRRGRLDMRRTIRAATTSGGVPVRLRFRGRRPARPDLVALCDLSGSVAAASELLLGLLAPAADYFRRVTLYGYVDRLCPLSIEDGHVAPGGPLDLHARSDFGRVLTDIRRAETDLLTGSTLLLVLGDARNNRLPPRADLLRALRARVQKIVWLVPEPRARWDTGDSVLGLYAPSCAAVVECVDLAALVTAVRQAL